MVSGSCGIVAVLEHVGDPSYRVVSRAFEILERLGCDLDGVGRQRIDHQQLVCDRSPGLPFGDELSKESLSRGQKHRGAVDGALACVGAKGRGEALPQLQRWPRLTALEP